MSDITATTEVQTDVVLKMPAKVAVRLQALLVLGIDWTTEAWARDMCQSLSVSPAPRDDIVDDQVLRAIHQCVFSNYDAHVEAVTLPSTGRPRWESNLDE